MEKKTRGPIRILHVFGKLGLGGAESRIVDLYRNINRRHVQFDFLIHADPAKCGKKCPSSEELMRVHEPEFFEPYILKMGGRIFAVPKFTGTNLVSYMRALSNLFAAHEGEWKMVQGHMTSTASVYLPIAKDHGVETTIAHVRSAGVDPGLKGKATKVLRLPLRFEEDVDYRFACSSEAARAVYGNRLVDEGSVKILPNAIDVTRFSFREDVRDRIRGDHGLLNAVIIGHVGRFHYAKNHEFLIRIFHAMKRLLREDKANEFSMLNGLRVVLFLLGEGPLMDEMQTLSEKLGIGDDVYFLGNRSNANEYYQAMDYFLFPSRYEGLPGTVVEAQAAGLQCLISDTVTKEVDATKLVSRMSINYLPEQWARKVLYDLMVEEMIKTGTNELPDEARLQFDAYAPGNRVESSPFVLSDLTHAGFDVKTQAKMMAYFYQSGHF